jgi:hypothetical protein
VVGKKWLLALGTRSLLELRWYRLTMRMCKGTPEDCAEAGVNSHVLTKKLAPQTCQMTFYLVYISSISYPH